MRQACSCRAAVPNACVTPEKGSRVMPHEAIIITSRVCVGAARGGGLLITT